MMHASAQAWFFSRMDVGHAEFSNKRGLRPNRRLALATNSTIAQCSPLASCSLAWHRPSKDMPLKKISTDLAGEPAFCHLR
jgi:hypothetical protein